MKTFKRLMLFMLALLTLVSVIPMTAISASAAPAADIPAEMLDNYVLDAMEYLGYDIAGHKASGDIYVDIGSSKTYKPPISYTGSLTGLETVTDTSTPTGKAPNVASFNSTPIGRKVVNSFTDICGCRITQAIVPCIRVSCGAVPIGIQRTPPGKFIWKKLGGIIFIKLTYLFF